MNGTFAFDVYGTLIDPYGVLSRLEQVAGEKAALIAGLWRDKQLEYTFRRAAMGAYQDFVVCTRQALDFACESCAAELSEDTKLALMAQYRTLPSYAEVPDALAALRERGHRMYAFSNGHPDDLAALLGNAGLDKALDGIVSVHDVASFKPDPAVYRHFAATTDTPAEKCCLVSGNPFDVIGAAASQWRSVWVRRNPNAVFDPWEYAPDAMVSDLSELSGLSL